MIMVCGINCNIQNSNRKISKIILYFVWVFIIIFIGPQMKDFWNILPSDSLYSMIDAITSPASTSLVDQSVSNTSGCPTFPHCVFSYVCSKNLDQSMQNHTDCICLAFLQCASSMYPQLACLRGCKITQVAFVWLFSTVHFQMPLQMTGFDGCKVTLVAFVIFFSMGFQMRPHRTWINACIVALVTFVWLFSTVCFQMASDRACMDWCKVTLIAFVRLFSNVCPQMASDSLPDRIHNCTGCICLTFLHCVFSNVFKALA